MSNIPTQAMVLAAGLGKRMRPLTDSIPKPMIEIAGRRLIDWAIDKLEAAGVTKIVINTSYMAEILEDYLKKRKTSDIIISREATPLETGGGIARALNHFGNDTFFSVNGDVIWLDEEVPALQRIAEAWTPDLDAVLLLHPVKAATGYEGNGDFFVDKEGYITRPQVKESAPYVYTGVQILHPRMFQDCPDGAFSLNLLYNKAMNASPPRIKSVIHDGALLHVGDPKGKKLAEEYILSVDSAASNG
jgi:MurNAc alpha-1-phosphate uridylyltransferase